MQRIVAVAVLGALAGGTWWLTRQVASPPPAPTAAAPEGPDYIVENFHITAMDAAGRPKHDLTAARMTRYPADGSRELEQPYLIQYSPGQAPLHVRANKGRLSAAGDQIVFQDNVHMQRGRDPRGAGGSVRTQTLTVRLDE